MSVIPVRCPAVTPIPGAAPPWNAAEELSAKDAGRLQGRRQMVRVTGEERPGKLPCPPLLPTIGQCAASAAATVTARDRCGRRAAAAGLLRTGAVAPSAAGPALVSPCEMTLADAARRASGRA